MGSFQSFQKAEIILWMPSFGASRDYRTICTSQSLEPIAKDIIYANIFQVLSLIPVNHVLTFKKTFLPHWRRWSGSKYVRDEKLLSTEGYTTVVYGTRISHQTASAEVEDIVYMHNEHKAQIKGERTFGKLGQEFEDEDNNLLLTLSSVLCIIIAGSECYCR